MASTMTKTPGMTIVGACTSPDVINAAKPATATMQMTTPPPTTTARRRASAPPRRHSVTEASMTNARSKRLPSCGTMARGLAMPMGPVTMTPAPQGQRVQRGDFGEVDVRASHEVQRQCQQANTGGRPGEPDPSGVEVETHKPDDGQPRKSPMGRAPSAAWRRRRQARASASSPARRHRRLWPKPRARRRVGGRAATSA